MISIVITERERFAFTRESVLSVMRHLERASEVLYVGGDTPAPVVSFLRGIARKNRKFKLILEERPVGSNEARNIGMKASRPGNDIVLVQNDVVVRKGWIQQMERCARETGAAVVAPLVLEGDPDKGKWRIHDGGASFVQEKGGERRLVHWMHQRVLDLKKLQRNAVDIVEFHCLLVRKAALKKIRLDERLEDLASHMDFSLECGRQGGKMVVEPRAQVVFAHPVLVPVFGPGDLKFFLERWSERNCEKEISIVAQRWGVPPKAHYLWEKRAWAVLYKAAVCQSFGVLLPPELFLWRATRTKWCPEWFRGMVERYMTARVLARVG